jgi:hypothetical protein
MSGGSLLEAACAGAPVVASDIAAHLEVASRLDPGSVRVISSQASPLVLADEIVAAIDEAPTSRPTPDVASWRDAAVRTVGLYRDLLERPSGAPILRAVPRNS